MIDRLKNSIEYIGGKKIFCIVAGVIFVAFLITSIGININKNATDNISESSSVETVQSAES